MTPVFAIPSPFSPRSVFLLGLVVVCVTATGAAAQEEAPVDSVAIKARKVLLNTVESYVGQGRVDDAIALLEQRREADGADSELDRRLAYLYRDAQRWGDVEALMAERVAEDGDEAEVADLRLLAEARFALGKREEALAALKQILDLDPEEPSLVRLAARILARQNLRDDAIELLVEGRERLGDPNLFAQQLGRLYSDQGMAREASREFLRVIANSPANLNLMRGQILQLATTAEQSRGVSAAVVEAVEAHPEVPQLRLLLAEMRQRAGDARGAWEALEPLFENATMFQDLLQMAMAALADSRLPGADPEESLTGLRLAERVLYALLDSTSLPRNMEPRVFDTLNRTLLAMMESSAFENLDKVEQEEILEAAHDALTRMGRRYPENRYTTAALLRLAGFYVDALHRPAVAIPLYQRLQLSPNIGREHMLEARVGLGRAYVASQDTAAARALFSTMARNTEFKEGQGRAHYFLGMLDIMGGSFKTAQDRLAVVAMDASTAPYANDALDLAILLAAETLEEEPDNEGLLSFGRVLYYRETLQPDSLRAELDALTRRDSPVALRARLELGRHHHQEGRPREALKHLGRLTQEAPDSRLAPQALHLSARILEELEDPAAARLAYEQLLLEYEDYVFLDAVRERIRNLPEVPQKDGDLP